MRASDADREAVAERLRLALNEGRLDLAEYDDRLQRAYASKTYAELHLLLADLPEPAAPERSRLAPYPGQSPAPTGAEPGPDGRYPNATRKWLADTWHGYFTAVAIVIGIWGVSSVMSREVLYFWPGWVAGPWGAVLLTITVSGLVSGEPQRWAAKRARKKQARRERRARRGPDNPAVAGPDNLAADPDGEGDAPAR